MEMGNLKKEATMMQDTEQDISQGDREPTFEEICHLTRSRLKNLETQMVLMMQSSKFNDEQAFPRQHSEMRANIMLTVRHIEDARMRIGKILQYADDGVSILDK